MKTLEALHPNHRMLVLLVAPAVERAWKSSGQDQQSFADSLGVSRTVVSHLVNCLKTTTANPEFRSVTELNNLCNHPLIKENITMDTPTGLEEVPKTVEEAYVKKQRAENMYIRMVATEMIEKAADRAFDAKFDEKLLERIQQLTDKSVNAGISTQLDTILDRVVDAVAAKWGPVAANWGPPRAQPQENSAAPQPAENVDIEGLDDDVDEDEDENVDSGVYDGRHKSCLMPYPTLGSVWESRINPACTVVVAALEMTEKILERVLLIPAPDSTRKQEKWCVMLHFFQQYRPLGMDEAENFHSFTPAVRKKMRRDYRNSVKRWSNQLEVARIRGIHW